MTKELREGIGQIIQDWVIGDYPAGAQTFHHISKAIVNYLHSKGVVIRVERELPEIDFDDVSDIERTRLMNSVSRHTVDILLKAGLVFTKSLIEEGV